MPKVSDEHKDTRRKQILKAAYDCFGSKGFHQTSMRDICEKANLSTGAVYNYFDGKDDIIETLSKESQSSNELLLQDVEPSDTTNEALVKILRRVSEVLHTQNETGELAMKIHLWSEALHSPKVAEVFERNMNRLIDQLAQCLDEVSKSEKDISLTGRELAKLILAVYSGTVLQRLFAPSDNQKDSFQTLISLFTGES